MKKFIILSALLFIALMPTAHARVDMVPQMVVMESRERSGEIYVLNLSNEVRQFEITMVYYEQTEKGTYITLEKPKDDAFDFQKSVRFSPRTFTLGPQGKQTVRVSLRRPADLPDGEYRFHMKAISYATDQESTAAGGEGNLAVGMAVNVAIAIPIVIRQGELVGTTQLSDFELLAPNQTKSEKTELHFTGTRTGDASTLGAIHVEWAQNSNDYKEIGMIKNFNIFTDIATRKGQVRLDEFPVGGKLRVIYRDFTDKKIVLDEVIIDL